jgi:hypothetical protein
VVITTMGRWGRVLKFPEQVRALTIRQPDIEKDEIERVTTQEILGLAQCRRHGHLVAALPQLRLQILAEDQIVLQDHDFLDRHGAWISSVNVPTGADTSGRQNEGVVG